MRGHENYRLLENKRRESPGIYSEFDMVLNTCLCCIGLVMSKVKETSDVTEV